MNILRVVLIAAVLGIAVVAGGLIALHTRWGEEQLARLVEAQAERALDGDVSIARVHGNLLRGATVEGLMITREGQPLISAERLHLRYDAIGLIRGSLAIEEVTLVRPVMYLVQGPNGLTLFDLLESTPTPPDTTARPYSIDTLLIADGLVVIGEGVAAEAVQLPDALEDVDAELTVAREQESTSIRIAHLSFAGREPRLLLQQLTGAIRVSDHEVIFDEVTVQTSESKLTVDGSLQDLRTTGGPR